MILLNTQKNDIPKYGHFYQVNHLISPQDLNSPLRIYVQFIVFMTVGERIPTKKINSRKNQDAVGLPHNVISSIFNPLVQIKHKRPSHHVYDRNMA
jgi:hypothetical protein